MAWGGAHRGNTFGRRRFGTPVDPVEEEFTEDYDELTDEDLDLIEELENEDEDFLNVDNDD